MPTKPTSTPILEEPINPGPFKGFLLAAYRSIAKTTRLTKITRNALISYLLLLVIIPPIVIMVAFFVSPIKTAGFFNFQIQTPPPHLFFRSGYSSPRGKYI